MSCSQGDDETGDIPDVPVAHPLQENEVRIVIAQLTPNHFEARVKGHPEIVSTGNTGAAAIRRLTRLYPHLFDGRGVVRAELRIDPSILGQ